MVGGEADHQGGLGVQPAAREAIAEPQPKAKPDRQHAERGDEAVQLARHQQQPLAFGPAVGRNHGQVDEDARQVEQPGEPADDEDDVEGFYPEHDVPLPPFPGRGGGESCRLRRTVG
jgi:hypothetical protein